MKKQILISIFLIGWTVAGPCSGAETGNIDKLFLDGNNAYEIGDFDTAIKDYKQILDSGVEGFNIYYNLGNAFYRKEDIARARVYYERAKRLKAGDADLEANEKFVLSNVRTVPAARKGIMKIKILRDYYDKNTLDELAVKTSFLYICCIVMLFICIIHRNCAGKLAIITILCFILGGGHVYLSFLKINEMGSKAIVVNSEAMSYYGPSESATVFFDLYEGNMLDILVFKDGWCKIRRDDGKSGWTRKEYLEII